MGKKIRLVRQESDSFWFHIKSMNIDVFIPQWNWGVKVDLKNMEYIGTHDDGYEESTLPTLCDLHDDVEMGFPYKEFDVIVKDNYNHNLSDKGIDKVVKQFKENGWNVTREAVEHQLGGWKCGYRDEANGYHLFTPCAGNELSFRATTLHDACKDWQTTYWC